MCHRPSILDIMEKATGWSKYHVVVVYLIWKQTGMQRQSEDQENLRELIDSQFGDISDALDGTTTKI